METKNLFAVILCGGTGPRLWPLSRADHPKQFLKIFNNQSLLSATISRFLKIVPPKNLFIVSNSKYKEEITKHIPGVIPTTNLLFEPTKKNTTTAILYAVSKIKSVNPDAIIISSPSDQYIPDIKKFKNDILSACHLAAVYPKIVTLGIKPNSPNPAYGYILPHPVKNYIQVNKFIEKPTEARAKQLISQKCFWNSGIYIFSVTSLIEEVRQLTPEYLKVYHLLEKNLFKAYSLSPDLSLDKSVSEKTKNLLVVPASFGWSDIGDWKAIFLQSAKKPQNFSVLNSSNYLQLNSSNCLVSAPVKKLVGFVGVSNLAIVDTPDALLVCNISGNDSFTIRDLVGQITASPKLAKYFLKSSNHEK